MLPVSNEVYQDLYREIRENTEEDSIFLSWWDNSLRINLFTVRAVLINEFLDSQRIRKNNFLWWSFSPP